jgi:hypothetical protein
MPSGTEIPIMGHTSQIRPSAQAAYGETIDFDALGRFSIAKGCGV